MKVKKFSFVLLLCCLAAAASAAARTAAYSGDDYNISLTYNDTCMPGDAVFVRMKMTASKGYKKSKTAATLELRNRKKRIDSTDFFAVKNGINGVEMLAGIPLSSFLEPEEYSLIITYSFSGMTPMEFTLPITVEKKEFNKETIRLNRANTAVKTDTSTARLDQVKKLNTILKTVNSGNIYQLAAFISPVTEKNRSAFFGDRRIYEYDNGKSSQSDPHYGIDYPVPEGTVVSACGAGKVVLAEKRTTTGWTVVIEHLPGLYSLYYHMKSLSVKDGQSVHQGDKIGLSGSTGLSTGPHLHWEVRLNTEAVSPDFFTTDFAFEEAK